MTKYLIAGIVLLALSPLSARAASPFDGTWKLDTSKLKLPAKPHVFALKDGMYSCKSCTPPITVKADGTDQPVTGHPYEDTVAITVVDDHTVTETDKKGGKTVEIDTITAAPDGKSLTFAFNSTVNPSAPPVTGKSLATRIGTAPAGAHAISGSWRVTEVDGLSDSATTTTMKTGPDGLSLSTPAGQSYTAKLDGTEAPYVGDPGITTVSVKASGGNTITETDKRDGKTIETMKMTVSPDGKTMTIIAHNKLRGTTTTMTAVKQS